MSALLYGCTIWTLSLQFRKIPRAVSCKIATIGTLASYLTNHSNEMSQILGTAGESWGKIFSYGFQWMDTPVDGRPEKTSIQNWMQSRWPTKNHSWWERIERERGGGERERRGEREGERERVKDEEEESQVNQCNQHNLMMLRSRMLALKISIHCYPRKPIEKETSLEIPGWTKSGYIDV